MAVVAAGAVAGTALEELVYRRFARTPDPERDEPIGSVPGRTVWVIADDDTKLYTRVYGPQDARGARGSPPVSKAAIVFAHGIVENHVIWHYLVRNLRGDGRHRLVAYDARGHGASGPVHGPNGATRFDADTLGHDLASVVDQTTAGPVVLVGHSLGGMAALTHLILDRAERVRIAGAVLINTTYTNEGLVRGGRATVSVARAIRRFVDRDPKRADRLRMSMNDLTILVARTIFGRQASPRQVAVAYHMYETTPAQTLAAATDLLTYDVKDDLAQIDVPVLVVGGSRDLILPVHLSHHIAHVIPDAELVIFEGCGHMAPFERHEELTAHIRKFADRVLS